MIRVLLQFYEREDGFNRKTEIAGMADEDKPFQAVCCVAPLISTGAFRVRQQADLLIVADGRHLHACTCGQLTNRKHDISLLKL